MNAFCGGDDKRSLSNFVVLDDEEVAWFEGDVELDRGDGVSGGIQDTEDF